MLLKKYCFRPSKQTGYFFQIILKMKRSEMKICHTTQPLKTSRSSFPSFCQTCRRRFRQLLSVRVIFGLKMTHMQYSSLFFTVCLGYFSPANYSVWLCSKKWYSQLFIYMLIMCLDCLGYHRLPLLAQCAAKTSGNQVWSFEELNWVAATHTPNVHAWC